ncbi:MAG TPA: VOC family protein [Solirubrobacteraceae bacterium]|jgi:predicted enzyme related to lactoylglutathione lyase|nr:VOC family protein [Solirubrobacteraceae bacterium]
MLSSRRAFSGFSVDDIAAARDFYSGQLGVEVQDMDNGLLTLHLADDYEVIVYPRPDHTPAAFTILNFAVEDIERAVDELSAAGVETIRYEGFDQDERGISRNPGGPPIAWFSDPAGNILAVLED